MIDKNTILTQIKNAVKSVDANADVILFGSQARGDVHEESDWDVLILTDENIDVALKRRFRTTILDIQINQGISIDSLVRNRTQWKSLDVLSLFQEIREEGIVL